MTSEGNSESVALVALGTNLPWRGRSPRAVAYAAVEKLSRLGGVEARSGLWETEAWPDPRDPPFYNLCVRLRTVLEPRALLAGLLALETEFGRVRGEPNAPRTLDLDVIDYAGRVLELPAEDGQPALELPHPRAHERAFVLCPLVDVAPTWRHPRLGLTGAELLARLDPDVRAGARRVADFAPGSPVALDTPRPDGDGGGA